MISEPEHCPLDQSRLVHLSGSYGARGVDLSVCYCPRCDVAFMCLKPTGPAFGCSFLQWHRRGGRLELHESCPLWEELPRQFREAWESNVRHHVNIFLE